MAVLWSSFAYLFLGLALVGLAVPLLPTTPFLLLAALCATRGSKRLRRWMYVHPRIGPILRQWDERQAIPLAGKLLSAVGLVFAAWMAWPRLPGLGARIALLVAFATISAYVWSRPLPARDRSGDDAAATSGRDRSGRGESTGSDLGRPR